MLAPCCDPAGPGQCFVGAEKFDLVAGRRKVAGAAQRRNKMGLLIQGSVQPPAEWGSREKWEQAMLRVGSQTQIPEQFEPLQLSESMLERATELANTRYRSSEYNERR
jgi:lipoate-protein ligase A